MLSNLRLACPRQRQAHTMADPEFEQIDSSMLAGAEGGMAPTMDQMSQQKEDFEKREEQKRTILNSVMSQEANQRLGTIRVVKPEKAEKVEMMVLQMAQRGQIREKIGEKQLMGLIETINEQEGGTTITNMRKTTMDDDGDDPIAAAMAAGARIPGKGGDDSDDY
eukprot:SAG22_NODE_33_length_27588_cov_104.174652_18_plen_165_part_00